MSKNPNLVFRRQFIASSKKSDNFPEWQYAEFPGESFHVYAHPDLEITSSLNSDNKIKLVLLGFAINPHFPEKQNTDIIKDLLSSAATVEDCITKISDLAGRFVFILSLNGRKYVIHDMCGLRTVYYSINDEGIFIASQPLLFKNLFNIERSEKYKIYVESEHYKNDIEYWLPGGLTLYENINQLVPNHYLDVSKDEQLRYWPVKKIKEQDLAEATTKSANMLERLMLSAKNRFKIALPITAGWDSRVLLAASKNLVENFFVYTLQYRSLLDKSPDIKIPKYMLRRFNIPFNKLDCRMEMNPEFYKIYKSNVDFAHDDYAKIANGMIDKFPQDKVVIRGNVSEIARCSFYPNGKHDEITSAGQLLAKWPVWNKIPYIIEYLDKWMNDVNELCKENNVDILDLWYMELFMSGWMAQNQLEWDIVHEEFTPYNYRPLIETLLGVPVKYRLRNKPILYEKILNHLWPELMYWPVNPPSWNKRHQFKYFIANLLKKTSLYNSGLKVYQIIYPAYLKIKGYKKNW